jgi:hypothetical protein
MLEMSRCKKHSLVLVPLVALFALSSCTTRVKTSVGIDPLAEKTAAVELTPKLELVSAEIEASNGDRVVRKGARSKATLLLKNNGNGKAGGVSVRLKPADNRVIGGDARQWWNPGNWWSSDKECVVVNGLNSDTRFTLEPGESQKVTISLDIGKDFKGSGKLEIGIELVTDEPRTANNVVLVITYMDDSDVVPPFSESHGNSSGKSGIMDKVGETASNTITSIRNVLSQVGSLVLGSQPSSEEVNTLPVHNIAINSKRYAIVVGIENYRQNLPRASFAVNDAKQVSRYLTRVLGYPEENVITLLNENAARNDMEKYFGSWLRNNVENESTVFM